MSSTNPKATKTVTPTKAYVIPKHESKEGVAKDKISLSKKQNMI